MSDFEKLVPELDLCKQIPTGAFDDSALVWDSDYENWYVVERDVADPDIAIPAPTLQEIMRALPESVEYQFFNGKFLPCHPKFDEENFADEKPENAALKLWLRLNKSDQSDQSDGSDNDRKGGAE